MHLKKNILKFRWTHKDREKRKETMFMNFVFDINIYLINWRIFFVCISLNRIAIYAHFMQCRKKNAIINLEKSMSVSDNHSIDWNIWYGKKDCQFEILQLCYGKYLFNFATMIHKEKITIKVNINTIVSSTQFQLIILHDEIEYICDSIRK